MMRFLPPLLAILSGGLLALCYPRWNIEEMVWLWAFPLMVALWWLPVKKRRRRFRRGFGLGYLAGIVFFGINFSWISNVTVLGAIILPFYLGLYVAVWGGIAATAGRPRDGKLHVPEGEVPGRFAMVGASGHALRCAFLNAAAWVGLEWLRGWVFTGFGWNGLGVAFHDNLNLIQIADIVGVTGLSFLPIFAGSVLLTTVRRFQLEIRHQQLRPHLDFGIALATVAGTFLYGLGHTLKPPSEGRDLKCVMVQLAVPQEEKWDPSKALGIVREFEQFTTTYVESTNPDLVLWPESSLPSPLFVDPGNAVFLNRILSKGEFALMLGVNDVDFESENTFKAYNAAALMAGSFDSPELQVYHKSHLVPFGEFVPFRDALPFLDAWFKHVVPADFDRGRSTEPLQFPGKPLQVVPLICFEDTVGRLARKFIRPESQFLVNVTNDGWFRQSPAAEQHVANARFRCVELRRPMARACNTGVTCLIDDRGRVTAILNDPESGVFVKGALASTLRVPSDPPMTFYARFGDVFTFIVSACALVLILLYRRSSSS
ncbi:MAG: apolipoprotein N-acyltransferase [Verrucomicrobiaceae bacterium]|nr:apolipoprotein N-acyltransferase [Verrucomicrobiaceae bacterium]